jgi:hypothetical protein
MPGLAMRNVEVSPLSPAVEHVKTIEPPQAPSIIAGSET